MSFPLRSAAPSVRSLAWIGAGAPEDDGSLSMARFEDSDDFLLSDGAYGHDVYVVALEQNGVSALDLVRLLRKASGAVVAVAAPADSPELAVALQAGADLPLPLPVSPATLQAAMGAVARRAQGAPVADDGWRLDESAALLVSPRGTGVPLNATDLDLLRCFARSGGEPVPRAALMERLWGQADEAMANALHATVYRLRRRIEQVSGLPAPIQSVSRVGYAFREALRLSDAASSG